MVWRIERAYRRARNWLTLHFGRMRTKKEVQQAFGTYWEAMWYQRVTGQVKVGGLGTPYYPVEPPPSIIVMSEAASLKRKMKLPPELTKPVNAYEWGVIVGKRLALDWVLGNEWDDEGAMDT